MATKNSINSNDPIEVALGGTGAATLTGVLTGNGTSAVTANAITQHGVLIAGASNAVSSLGVAASSTVLQGSTGADPAFTATPTVTSITLGSGSALSTFNDWTSWTPVISFGGGTTGITYTTQTGSYMRIGNGVYLYMNITLSSKGSSSGNMVINGLPFTVNTNASQSVIYDTITFVGNSLGCLAVGGTATLIVYRMTTAAAVAQLADTNMANTSSLFISGFYRV